MTIEDLRAYRNAQPFESFDIVMQDGTVVHVAAKERMAVAFNGAMAYVFEGSRLSFVDVARVAALNHRKILPPWQRGNA